MSNTNNAAKLGLVAFNESQQAVVVSKAQNLIANIRSCQKTIASAKLVIKAEQEQLNKLSLDVIKVEDVLGRTPTGTLNANEVTILKAIEKSNEAAQASVKLASEGHLNRIKAQQASIKTQEEYIAKYRKDLSELSIDVATEADLG